MLRLGRSRFFGAAVLVGTMLSAASALGQGQPAPATQTPRITLVEAIERANRVQPSVVSAFGSVRNANARKRSSFGAFLPNLTVSGSVGDFYSEGARIDPSTGQLVTSGTTNRSVNSNLNSSIELFDGWRRPAERRAANANLDAAEAGLVSAQFDQQLTTTNAYFDVLAAEQLLTVRQASVRRAEEQLNVSVNRLHAGSGIRSDSLRSLVTLGQAQLSLLDAQTQLAVAQANLGRIVGADGPVGAVDDSSLYSVMTTVDTAAIRAEALSKAPSVIAADASARASRAAVGVSKAAYFPTLNLSTSFSLNGSRQNDYTFLQQRQLNLQLNWPIFNRFQREQSIANAVSSAESADANAAESRRQVLADVTSSLASLEAARLRIGITQTSVQAAREDLRVQQERFRLGAGTIVDVLTSQEALDQAEVDAVNARFDYVRARAELSALIGRPL
jgi:outer membrane protein TolC